MFVKFDENNNCVRYGIEQKNDDTYLEVGIDIFWKIDVERNGEIITISPNEMISNEKVVKFYDNPSEFKLCEENGIKTIRFKTDEEKQQEINLKKQQDLLIKLQPLMIAINIQENGIAKGASIDNAIFTDQQIIDWTNYIGSIAKGNLDVIMPELPEAYKNLLGI